MIAFLRLSSFILFAGLVACAPPKESERVLVRTRSGPVAGVVDKDIFVFKGIPYAAAPWTKNRDGKAFGPDCGDGPDCLTLSVWAPPGKTKAPVIVSDSGNTGNVEQDARMYVKNGNVFVSINIRSNWRTSDSRAVEAWITANIAEFGGDPNNVSNQPREE